MAVAAEAWAAPAPTNPNPLLPSPARDQAVLSTLISAAALEGPINDTGARNRENSDVVALTLPSCPTANRWPPAWITPTAAIMSVVVPLGVFAEWKAHKSSPFFFIHPPSTA